MFSSANRITVGKFFSKLGKRRLCRGAWGTQFDAQCLGYDSLCGLAIMFYDKDSYQAVYDAQEEVRISPYSKGFQNGWDGDTATDKDSEYLLGYKDGNAIVSRFSWRSDRPSDGAYR